MPGRTLEAGFTAGSDRDSQGRRLNTCVAPEEHPREGPRRHEPAPRRVDSETLGPLSTLIRQQGFQVGRRLFTIRPPQVDLIVDELERVHSRDRSSHHCGVTLIGVEGFPIVVPIQVRWRDLDALAHVNNAAVITYVETARTVLWRERFGGGAEIPFLVARLEVRFRKQITLDDTVHVGLRVTDLRGARFTFEYRIETNGELAAEAMTVMAHVHPGAIRPTRIPGGLRRRLAELQAAGE